ncbi:MAG: HAD family hydrolase [Saccharofermentanales bacterium]|jgi:pyrophosphatase PpaX|nr:HAD-IA family hydrolase [Clostridiaceae bacterium]
MTDRSFSRGAAFFDLDGTLLDTVPLIIESYQHTFRHFLGEPGNEADILAGIGIPLDDFFRNSWPEQAEVMKAVYLQHNHARLDTHIAIFREVPVMLERLRRLKIPMGIVTSKRQYAAMRSLRFFDLEHYFQIFVVKESTLLHKPNPDPLYEAMRQMRIDSPARVVYIGDSLHDLHSAKRAGCRSAIVDWTAMPREQLLAADPDLWLTKTEELVDYFKHL